MKPVHVRRTQTGEYVAEVEGVNERVPAPTAVEALRQAQQVAGEGSFAAPTKTADLTVEDSSSRSEVAADTLPSAGAKAADTASPSSRGARVPVSLTA
jgi:hypothetical protein